jgi:hypothetical protein
MVGGSWFGWYVQSGAKVAMACYLEQHRDIVRGWGGDQNGVFGIHGSVSRLDGRVAWIKTYLGRHSIRYSGVLHAVGEMRGLWFISYDLVNAWELRQLNEAPLDDAVRDLVSCGIAAWLSGDYNEAGLSFVKAAGIEKRPELALAAAALLKQSFSIAAAKEQLLFAQDWLKLKATRDADAVSLAINNTWAKLGLDDHDGQEAELAFGTSEPLRGNSANNVVKDDGRGAAHALQDAEKILHTGTAADLDAPHGGNPDLMNSLAWSKYEAGKDLDGALTLAQLAYQRARNRFSAHTLCAILVRLGQWENARPLFAEWMFGLGRSKAELRLRWDLCFRPTFQDIIDHGDAGDAADLFGELGDPLPWLRDELLRAARGEEFSLLWPDESK